MTGTKFAVKRNNSGLAIKAQDKLSHTSIKKIQSAEAKGRLYFIDSLGNDLLSVISEGQGKDKNIVKRKNRLVEDKLVSRVYTQSIAAKNRLGIILEFKNTRDISSIFNTANNNEVFIFRDLDV